MAKGARKPHVPRNYEIAPGLMRFSRARMYQKLGVYKKKPFPVIKKKLEKPEQFTIKKVGGDKNGGERRVPITKQPRALAESRDSVSKKQKRSRPHPKTRLRASITPGTVLILLASRHKGKRVVFLKQLDTGMLLVTGPLRLNNCPLRRIPQAYVIATRTKLDISGIQIPEHINDDYFKRQKKAKKALKKEDTEIFATKKSTYELSDQRKEDQKSIDKQILDVIRKNKDKKLLFGYIGSSFALRKNEHPHKMIF